MSQTPSSTHSPFDTCQGKGFSSGMKPPKHFERNFSHGGKFRLLYVLSFLLPDFTFLIYIIRVEKKVTKDTKTGHEKIRATYFGDKCSILVAFNTLMVLSVLKTSYENQWDSRKFHVSFAAEILNIQELYGEPNKIRTN